MPTIIFHRHKYQRWQRREFVLVTFATLLSNLPIQSVFAAKERDHLVPVEYSFERGPGATYRRLYERKLFVTSGSIARYVFLPAGKGAERAAALYRAPEKRNSLSGGYWVTATEASGHIWNCIVIPGEKELPLDPRTITVTRRDAPLPETTARAIQDLWLSMLTRARPPPPGIVTVDSSAQIFSAAASNGTFLRGRTDSLGPNSLALIGLGESVINYCQAPPSERAEFARKIEKASYKLLRRVQN